MTVYSGKTLHQFLRCLTIRHPITFGKKAMMQMTTGPEEAFPHLEKHGHFTPGDKEDLEKTILIMLRFLLTGDKHTTIMDDALTAVKGIIDDKVLDQNQDVLSDIISLNHTTLNAVYRLTRATVGYRPRARIAIAVAADILKIISWLYDQITCSTPTGTVYIPVITEKTADLRNIFVTPETVWAVDIWAIRLRTYSPRQAMGVLSLLRYPLEHYPLTFTPALTTPFPAVEIGVLCPQRLARYWYHENCHVPGLVRRWSETFDRYLIGLDIY